MKGLKRSIVAASLMAGLAGCSDEFWEGVQRREMSRNASYHGIVIGESKNEPTALRNATYFFTILDNEKEHVFCVVGDQAAAILDSKIRKGDHVGLTARKSKGRHGAHYIPDMYLSDIRIRRRTSN